MVDPNGNACVSGYTGALDFPIRDQNGNENSLSSHFVRKAGTLLPIVPKVGLQKVVLAGGSGIW